MLTMLSDAPMVHCDQRSAELNEYNVYLSCQVRAKPEVTSLFWVVDVNGTTLAEGDETNGYWSMVTVSDNGPGRPPGRVGSSDQFYCSSFTL